MNGKFVMIPEQLMIIFESLFWNSYLLCSLL